MAKWNEYGLKTGTSARDEVLILDSDTNTNKRITVGDIQEFANDKMLEKENATLNTEAKTLIGAIDEVDAKNDAQDARLEEIEKKFSGYVKKTDVDSTLSVSGSPADAKAVGDALKNSKEAIEELADKKITKFYASSQGNTHLPDSDKGKIQDMFLYGKSEQVQYKGKNLLNPILQTQTKNGVTCTANGDGTYTINGTATADTIFTVFSQPHKIFKDHKQLKLVGFNKTFQFNYIRLQAYFKNYRIFYDEGNGVIIDKPETDDSNIAIYVFKNATITNLTFKPMLTPDLTATYDDFEPYVGGIPSPSPEYPQEIKAVVNPKVVVSGKNLLNPTLGTKTILGVTCIANGDGTYTVNGTAEQNVYFYFTNKNIVLNKPFRVAGCPSGGSILTYYLLLRYKATNKFIINENNHSVNVNLSDNTTFDQFGIGIRSGTTVNNVIFKPMLTYDMDVSYDDFVPYQPEQSVTLPYTLYAIPVSTGGNVTIGSQQYVADYVDVERGKLVRMCKEIDFAKTKQNMYQNILANTKEVRYLYKDLGIKELDENHSVLDGAGYINKASFAGKTTWAIDREGVFSHGQGSGDKNLTLRIPKNADAREYFTSIGGCKGIFQIATPEEIDLTPEQIQAYKSLSTNYPVTNIEVSSNQLDGYTIFNYPISMENGWNYVKQQIGDTRDYIYDMDLQSAEAYVNSEYAVALAELEVM